MTITIVGFTSDDKVPGFYGETKYGQGRVSIGAMAIYCTVMGHMVSGGTATADTEVYDVFDADQAADLFGARSELANMCNAALEVEGVTLKAVAVAEPGGGTQATLTATIGGTWSTSGDVHLWLAGKRFSTTADADTTNTPTLVAAALVAEINADASLPMTAANVAGVITATVANVGVRGNYYIAVKDLTEGPSGLTLALAGGTALTGGAVPFSGGAGTDDISDALATLASDQYGRIACATDDATNADLLRDQINSKAGPTIALLEHFVYCKTRGLTAAASFSQTDLNEYRGQVYWQENQETHPSQIAAWIAAYRSTVEGDNPNQNYDDIEVAVATPQKFKGDLPLHSELKTALNQGVSPLQTTRDGRVTIVRSITAHSLNGAAADYRCYDVGEAVVPDRIRQEIGAYWAGEFKVSNPYVGPDPAGGAAPTEGTGTPTIWNASLISEVLRPAETANWIADVDGNLPVTEYNSASKRLMSAVPVVVKAHQHQIGVSVRQQAA